ncbi:MAG: hypothetical protein V5A44_09525 [Haloarculaceae archaeon]
MRPARSALLAFALAVVVVTPAAAVPATADLPAPSERGADTGTLPVIRAQSNTTNFLDIRGVDVQRGGYSEASLDGSTAVATAVSDLRADYASRSFGAAYANATTQRERVAVVRAEVDRLAARIDALERRQSAAIDAYNDGELTARGFVAALARTDASARSVQRQFERILDRAGLILPGELQTRINNRRADLIPLRSRVRAETRRSMVGTAPATGVYTLTSPSGLVVTTTDGERFYREAYLGANRDRGGEDGFVTDDDPTGLNPANDRARQLYPWAYRGTSPELSREGTTAVYTVAIDHSQGRLTTHLDGATRNVFREQQVLRTNRVPVETVRNQTASVALRVNVTYSTGPMQVVATDPVTGQPLNGTVTVDGYRVGATGADGELWTTGPHPAGTVVVSTDEGVASVRVEPR